MKAFPRFSVARRPAGFTLIELLVVIAIIAVLAGLLVSVAGRVQLQARKTQITSDERNIKVACVSYYTDNRQYPLGDVQISAVQYQADGYVAADSCYGDPGGLYPNFHLFNLLRGLPDPGFIAVNNPNPTVYWEGQFVKNPSTPRDGITLADFTSPNGYLLKKGTFVDPWGNEYLIFLDANKDGDLSDLINKFYSDSSATVGTIHPGEGQGLALDSLGADGKLGTKGNGILKGADDVLAY